MPKRVKPKSAGGARPGPIDPESSLHRLLVLVARAMAAPPADPTHADQPATGRPSAPDIRPSDRPRSGRRPFHR